MLSHCIPHCLDPKDESVYTEAVEKFAALGKSIISLDPRTRYESVARNAPRPLEPGFIPVESQPRIVTVTYYPNETELPNEAFQSARKSFVRWGETGSVADYAAAYHDWVELLPSIQFHRKWNVDVFAELGIANDEFAWLPLIKCPLPAESAPSDEDVYRDKLLLWDQLWLLKPRVLLIQGVRPFDVVAPMCDKKWPHAPPVLQKIPRRGDRSAQTAEIVRKLRAALNWVANLDARVMGAKEMVNDPG